MQYLLRPQRQGFSQKLGQAPRDTNKRLCSITQRIRERQQYASALDKVKTKVRNPIPYEEMIPFIGFIGAIVITVVVCIGLTKLIELK
jgi:hypothetical protein